MDSGIVDDASSGPPASEATVVPDPPTNSKPTTDESTAPQQQPGVSRIDLITSNINETRQSVSCGRSASLAVYHASQQPAASTAPVFAFSPHSPLTVLPQTRRLYEQQQVGLMEDILDMRRKFAASRPPPQ